MVNCSRLFMMIENCTNQEWETPHQKRNIHTLLQDLNVTISSLINLARIMNRSYHPQHRTSNQHIQSMLFQFQVTITSFLFLHNSKININYFPNNLVQLTIPLNMLFTWTKMKRIGRKRRSVPRIWMRGTANSTKKSWRSKAIKGNRKSVPARWARMSWRLIRRMMARERRRRTRPERGSEESWDAKPEQRMTVAKR